MDTCQISISQVVTDVFFPLSSGRLPVPFKNDGVARDIGATLLICEGRWFLVIVFEAWYNLCENFLFEVIGPPPSQPEASVLSFTCCRNLGYRE